MSQSLFVVLLLSAAVSQGSARLDKSPKVWPCPNDADILPCNCTFDVNYNLFMDCSLVTSSDQLALVFSANFPSTHFQKFIINQVTPQTGFVELPVGVFGPAYFDEVSITNTFIATIHEEVFVNSHDSLQILNLADNVISSFPIETLALFTVLREFDISNNRLPTDVAIPDIVSSSLQFINLSGNRGVTLSADTFVGAQGLEDVLLNDMDLGTTSNINNMFMELGSLRNLELKNNQYIGRLRQDFINPTGTSLVTVLLMDNQISDIHVDAIKGLSSSAYVDFQNNELECLLKPEWEPLLNQVGDNAIDLRGNPLVCGCDVYWLATDLSYMKKIHNETICSTGIRLYDLDIAFFLNQCPDGPDGEPVDPCVNRPPYY